MRILSGSSCGSGVCRLLADTQIAHLPRRTFCGQVGGLITFEVNSPVHAERLVSGDQFFRERPFGEALGEGLGHRLARPRAKYSRPRNALPQKFSATNFGSYAGSQAPRCIPTERHFKTLPSTSRAPAVSGPIGMIDRLGCAPGVDRIDRYHITALSGSQPN